ncbi:MAG: hypothetical protein M3Z66_17430 [Chloroflexota bacterium]|nr:hypothetical protein [Chloroflexota bacterium]
MTRRNVSLIAAAVIIVVAVILTSAPIPGFLGLDAGSVGALEVSVATILATVLVWYGLRT